MNHANLTAGLSLGCTDSLVTTVSLLAVAGAATYSAMRALFADDTAAHLSCRRWAMTATTALIAWYLLSRGLQVNPRAPLLVAVATVSCWIIALNWSVRQIPRAAVRRRSS